MVTNIINNPFSFQKLTRNELIAAGWYEEINAATGRSYWKRPGDPIEYSLNGAKYTQSVLQR